jgi:hypothetical protein
LCPFAGGAIRGKRRTGSKAVQKPPPGGTVERGEPDSRLPIQPEVHPAIAIDAAKGRVPIKDHAGETLEWVPIAKARALIAAGTVEILGTRRKIRALRFRQAEPVMERRFFPVRKAGFGAPHRRETQQNPRGCWHLEYLRDSTRSIFSKVLDDCRAA